MKDGDKGLWPNAVPLLLALAVIVFLLVRHQRRPEPAAVMETEPGVTLQLDQ